MQKKRTSLFILLALSTLFVLGLLFVPGCKQEVPQQNSDSEAMLDAVLERAKNEAELEKARLAHEAELKEPFYVLLMGGDARENTAEGNTAEPGYNPGRSDTMILTKVWPETGSITMVTIPRDTRATYEGSPIKINDILFRHGPEAAVETVESMAGVDIKYYYVTDFARFIQLIDTIGGVTVNSPGAMNFKDVMTGDRIYIEEGENNLDGAGALVFTRIRKAFAGNQDACRQIQDRQVVQRVLESVPGMSNTDLLNILEGINKNTDTNLPSEDLAFYANYFSKLEDGIYIQQGTFPYEGWLNEDIDMWAVPYDEGKWKEVIAKVEEGGNPADVVQNPEVLFN